MRNCLQNIRERRGLEPLITYSETHHLHWSRRKRQEDYTQDLWPIETKTFIRRGTDVCSANIL